MTSFRHVPTAAALLLALTVAAGASARRDRSPEPSALADLSASLEELSERVAPAVVQVFAVALGTEPEPETGSDTLVRRRSRGSGVVVDPRGYVLTNAHVVEKAQRVEVSLAEREPEGSPRRSILQPGGRRVPARLVGLDVETDIAVLKIEASDLPSLPLGDSDELRPGQVVLAFGSPMGLANSVSMGVVSSTAQQLRTEGPMVYVQTDATINPGNSGGPLVDVNGQVMGINTLILSQSGGSEGLGFAVPSNIARYVYEQIRESGRVRRGVVGLNAQTITPELARGLDLPRDWGVIVGDVHPDGPAWLGGVEVGDIVLDLDGKPIENGRQLDVNLYRKPIGRPVRLGVLRGGKRLELEVRVAERDDELLRFSELVDPDRDRVPELGVVGLELTQGLRDLLPGIRSTSGVFVAARLPGSAHGDEGLRLGDVVRTLDGRQVPNLATLRAVLGSSEGSRSVVAHVERSGRMAYLVVPRE